MRVLVCGDRNWADEELIEKSILRLHLEGNTGAGKISLIISGEAEGADSLAKKVSSRLGLKYSGFPALWEKYGKAAGPLRNKQMLEEGKPELILAFHDDLDHSKGTKDMVERARKAGVPVKVISHK